MSEKKQVAALCFLAILIVILILIITGLFITVMKARKDNIEKQTDSIIKSAEDTVGFENEITGTALDNSIITQQNLSTKTTQTSIFEDEYTVGGLLLIIATLMFGSILGK